MPHRPSGRDATCPIGQGGPEFRERYEAIRPGFAAFLRDAMAVYAEGLKPRT